MRFGSIYHLQKRDNGFNSSIMHAIFEFYRNGFITVAYVFSFCSFNPTSVKRVFNKATPRQKSRFAYALRSSPTILPSLVWRLSGVLGGTPIPQARRACGVLFQYYTCAQRLLAQDNNL